MVFCKVLIFSGVILGGKNNFRKRCFITYFLGIFLA